MRLGVAMVVLALLSGCQDSLSPEWGIAGDDDDGIVMPDPFPESISIAPIAGGVRVSWTAAPGADGYRVFLALQTGVGQSVGLPGAQTIESEVTSVDVRGMPDLVPRFAAVAALFGGRVSALSPEVSTAPLASGWDTAAPSTTAWWSTTGIGGGDLGSSLSGGDFNGDGFSDLVVGADDEDGTFGNSGRVRIYAGSATGIVSPPAAILEGIDADEEFGDSAAVGDADGDGFLDLIVGSRDYDSAVSQANEGRVALFSGSPGPWPQSQVWSFETNQAGAQLGNERIAFGDFDGDGLADVAMGAMFYDGGVGASEGRVYVVYGATGPGAPFLYEGGTVGGELGCSVTVADMDGDGYDELIAGASEFDVAGDDDNGRIFVFDGGPSGLVTPPALMVGTIQTQFGSALIGADVNGDGRDELIVTGFEANGPAGNDTGRAYLVYETTGGLLAYDPWIWEPDDPGAALGEYADETGVADVNGDGFQDVILSAGRYDLGAVPTRAGGAFLFLGSPAGLTPDPVWDFYGTATSNDELIVSGVGDIDGDGGEEFAIGFHTADVARVFHGIPASGPTPEVGTPHLVDVGELVAPAGATYSDFGAGGHTCSWDFGDGTTLEINPCPAADIGDVSHAYDEPGLYVLRVRVTNGATGASGESATLVRVARRDLPPL